MLYFYEVKFGAKDDKWKVFYISFLGKKPRFFLHPISIKILFLDFSLPWNPKEVLVAQDSILVIDVLSLGHDVSFLC